MTKKNNWDFHQMKDSLVSDTEQRITDGFEQIKQEQATRQDGQEQSAATAVQYTAVSPQSSAAPAAQPSAVGPQPQAIVYRTARLYHKERTQDILVHCPQSLHRRLTDLKNHLWDEYGERVTINNMAVEAIALWLDQKAPLTPASDAAGQQQ